MISTAISAPGLTGFIEQPKPTGWAPESLRRIAQHLCNSGYMTDIVGGSLVSRQLGQAVHITTTGWLLTWWSPTRGTNVGLASFGRVWVAAGVEDSEIPFTTT